MICASSKRNHKCQKKLGTYIFKKKKKKGHSYYQNHLVPFQQALLLKPIHVHSLFPALEGNGEGGMQPTVCREEKPQGL